ncbi:hypothetical protein [Chryseobacterium kwangjuense]|uniref:Helix-turn-helix domain-containing protein n=1 Tax=Chryseobacterium kwangjuense TaxID=267125 RepID=A0A135WF34_9FLAO|nr:hypothetical protein [Chryseobacterium kwangjuense]KXH83519.1 transposase [Chryseobacterium kwangjuense]
MEKRQPDYKRIYSDIIEKRNPENKDKCISILNKQVLSLFDILNINSLIFDTKNKNTLIENQKHKSYNKDTILGILVYQKKYCLNNTQLANHFKLSRNSVAKWKKQYRVLLPDF